MDAKLNRVNGLIEIDGDIWMTRESFMLSHKIKKSNFYNLLNSGQVISRRLFNNERTLFYVYRTAPEEEQEVTNG